MPRRAPVKVLMQEGRWQLPAGQALPDLRDPPPDPVSFDEKLALNGTLAPAKIRAVMAERPGDSAATKTRRKYIAEGKCALCGVDGLVTKTMCGACAVKHRKLSNALKKRLAAHGLCVECGRKNTGVTLMCEACRAEHTKRYH